MVTPEPDDTATNVRLRADPIRVITLCMLGLLTAVTVALIVYQVAFVGTVRQTVECLQENAAVQNASILAGRAAAAKDRASQKELLLTPAATPEERRAALERYLRRLDEADAARTASPPPTRSCTSPIGSQQ